MKTFILDGRMYTTVREAIGGVMAKEQKTEETLFVSSYDYTRALADTPDTEGNKHTCKTHPEEICVKCLYSTKGGN